MRGNIAMKEVGVMHDLLSCVSINDITRSTSKILRRHAKLSVETTSIVVIWLSCIQMVTFRFKIAVRILLSLVERMLPVWPLSKVCPRLVLVGTCNDKYSAPELASHADVLEVSVVARSHPKWGERPMAFVILKADAVNKWTGKHNEFGDDLKRHAKLRLPGFACPEWVNVVEELPVSFLYYSTVSFKSELYRVENVDGKDTKDATAKDCSQTLIVCKIILEHVQYFTVSFLLDSESSEIRRRSG